MDEIKIMSENEQLVEAINKGTEAINRVAQELRDLNEFLIQREMRIMNMCPDNEAYAKTLVERQSIHIGDRLKKGMDEFLEGIKGV